MTNTALLPALFDMFWFAYTLIAILRIGSCFRFCCFRVCCLGCFGGFFGKALCFTLDRGEGEVFVVVLPDGFGFM